jgi:hypothetical protein
MQASSRCDHGKDHYIANVVDAVSLVYIQTSCTHVASRAWLGFGSVACLNFMVAVLQKAEMAKPGLAQPYSPTPAFVRS